MANKPGDRVGAVMASEGDTVKVFGYGVFEGYRIPDPKLQVQIFGERMEHENPCIRLDSGKLVFGCECWWGAEQQIRDIVAKYAHVVEVDIEQERLAYKPSPEETP